MDFPLKPPGAQARPRFILAMASALISLASAFLNPGHLQCSALAALAALALGLLRRRT